jgi:hypothetical protein
MTKSKGTLPPKPVGLLKDYQTGGYIGSTQDRFNFKTFGKHLIKEPVTPAPLFDNEQHLWLNCWLSHR